MRLPVSFLQLPTGFQTQRHSSDHGGQVCPFPFLLECRCLWRTNLAKHRPLGLPCRRAQAHRCCIKALVADTVAILCS